MVVILVNCGFMASNIEVPNSEYVHFCIFSAFFIINCCVLYSSTLYYTSVTCFQITRASQFYQSL